MVFDPDKQVPGGIDTVNEAFFDALLRHQIGLLRVSGAISNKVIALLDATEEDLRREIARGMRAGAGLGSPGKVRSLNKMLREIAIIRDTAWGQVRTVWGEQLLAIALAEPETVAGILKTVVPVLLEPRLPTARELKSIVTSQPFEGKTLKQWSVNIERADLSRISDQIKIGLTQQETTPEISRRVVGRVRTNGTDGVTEITRRQATAITRTAVNAIGNQTRREFFVDNADVFSKEQYVATLDARTTLICASLDGRIFPLGEGEIPPLHFQCRSIRVAVIDGAPLARRPAKPFTEQQLLREFTAQNDLARVSTRDGLPFGFKGQYDAFQRTRIRQLTGSVTDKVGYQAWLRSQSVEFQNDYLGKTKGQLFRSGTPLTSFVDPGGRPISLSELARVDADAFTAAGLDSSDFL